MSELERLNEISMLGADWDGEGAAQPSEVAITNARRFLRDLAGMGEPTAGVCSDGSIDLWWSPGGKTAALMNFTAAGGASFYTELGGMKFKGTALQVSGSPHAKT